MEKVKKMSEAITAGHISCAASAPPRNRERTPGAPCADSDEDRAWECRMAIRSIVRRVSNRVTFSLAEEGAAEGNLTLQVNKEERIKEKGETVEKQDQEFIKKEQ